MCGKPLIIRSYSSARAFTLFELALVIGILVVAAALAIPRLGNRLEAEILPASAQNMRSLLAMVRANAAFDGKRFRVRFVAEDEVHPDGDDRQPLVEREDDPLFEPDVFNPVGEPWARGTTLLGDVRCAEVRLGRPTVAQLRERRNKIEEKLTEAFEDFDAVRPPLFIEPDGTSQWVTFVLTKAPIRVDPEDLEDYPTVEVIGDGTTGLTWLQRRFYEEELDLFEEKNWPIVLRQDYLKEEEITEDRVLELRDYWMGSNTGR